MMNFENEKTEKCTNGCYFIITYEQKLSKGNKLTIFSNPFRINQPVYKSCMPLLTYRHHCILVANQDLLLFL